MMSSGIPIASLIFSRVVGFSAVFPTAQNARDDVQAHVQQKTLRKFSIFFYYMNFILSKLKFALCE
jgi:hypothetical protein